MGLEKQHVESADNTERQSRTELDEVVVIVPALNEEQSLPLVLQDLPPVGEVIVVDNGSTDRTAEVARQYGATVLSEPRRGYGAACWRGLEYLAMRQAPPNTGNCGNTAGTLPGGAQQRPEGQSRAERADGPEIVVFLDADYSDYPGLLPQLVRPIQDGEYDFVLGSRLQGERERGAMPLQSVLGNRFACFLMRWLLGVAYTDIGPFRAIRYASLRDLQMQDRDFGWTVEMQIKAAKNGLRIREVPVPYRRRIGQSKISGTLVGTIKAGYKILWTITRYGLLSRDNLADRSAKRSRRCTQNADE